jgi:type IV pilus biogenesis protein CpaD/CtpE
MKLLQTVAIAGLACLFLVACSEQSPITTGKVEQEQSQSQPQVATSAQTEPTEIDGILTQTEKGLAIVTETDTYIVAGQDLSDMVGQMVKVTGAVAEVPDGPVIQVMSVIPLEQESD